MSFARFGEGDVYVFEHVAGYITCCACIMADEAWASVDFSTPRATLKHLDEHDALGHDVEVARENILAEYQDLDIIIQPYEKPADS